MTSKEMGEAYKAVVQDRMAERSENSSGIYTMNYALNYEYLRGEMEQDRNPEREENPGPAIVIGSGASLYPAIERLNDIRRKHKARIFCTPSQLWVLTNAGVTPDYCVAFDAWFPQCPECDSMLTIYDMMHWECPEHGLFMSKDIGGTEQFLNRWTPEVETTIVATPGVRGEVLRAPSWRSHGKLFHLVTNPFINGERMHQWVRQDMIEDASWCIYSKRNPELTNPIKHYVIYAPSSTPVSCMLAHSLGHDPIYMVGNDLCNWRGRGRMVPVLPDGTLKEWKVSIPEEDKEGPPVSLIADIAETLKYVILFGVRLVDVIVDDTPGALSDALPSITLKRLARGKKRDMPIKKSQERVMKWFHENGWAEQTKDGRWRI